MEEISDSSQRNERLGEELEEVEESKRERGGVGFPLKQVPKSEDFF